MRGASVAARRAAAAMVHANGVEVRLEIATPPVAGVDGEQLGLSAPEFQVRVVSPVAVRVAKGGIALLIAAEVLESVLNVRGPGAVDAVMATVYAVVVGDVRYRLAGTECVRAAGDVCLYRLMCGDAGMEAV